MTWFCDLHQDALHDVDVHLIYVNIEVVVEVEDRSKNLHPSKWQSFHELEDEKEGSSQRLVRAPFSTASGPTGQKF